MTPLRPPLAAAPLFFVGLPAIGVAGAVRARVRAVPTSIHSFPAAFHGAYAITELAAASLLVLLLVQHAGFVLMAVARA